MRNIYTSIILTALLFSGIPLSAQLPVYDRPVLSVLAGADSAFCSATCQNITRTAVPLYENRAATTYTVKEMTMPNPAYNTIGPNVINVTTDDYWSPIIPIGFSFCYFGNNYTQAIIGPNGLISFNTALANGYCQWSFTGGLPDPAKHRNCIMGPYTDAYPPYNYNPNRVTWYHEGTAPNRRLVVNFYRIPMFSCNNLLLSSQIILHEAFSMIDVVIASNPACAAWNGGRSIVGIQDAAGVGNATVPGYNPATTSISNRCFRFTPNGVAPVYTVNWMQNGTIVSNNAVLNANLCPGTTTTFVATMQTTLCSGQVVTDRDTVDYTVNLGPVANAGANTSLSCVAPNIGIGSAPIAGNTYSWTPTAGLSNPNIANPTTNTPNIYYLTVTKTSTGCVNRDTIIVSPLTNPTANAGPDKAINCTNSTVQIGTVAVAGHTYSWSPSLGLSANNIAQPNASAPGTYTLTVTNTATGCTNTDNVTVTQDITTPTANAGADQTLTCTTPALPIGTAAVLGNTYAWSPAIGLSANNIAQPNATAADTYTLTVTKTANGCTATDDVTIAQNIIPVIVNAGVDKTLTCTTTSVPIGSAAIAGHTYSWSPAFGLSAANIAQPNATSPGNYTLTVTNISNGCSATDDITITQNITPPVANAGTNNTLTCTNTSFLLGSAAVAGNTYSWSPSAGLSANNIAQPNATSPGNYTLTVTNTANGCTATDVVLISQNINPPIANAGTDKTLTCTNPSLIIGSAVVIGNTYTWSPASGLSATNIAQPNATAVGTYTLTVTNTATGCTATDDVTITQNITIPVANAGADKILTCSNPSLAIGTTAIAGNTYTWSPSTGLSATNVAQPNTNAPGTYTLTVTNTANGCTATDDVTITQNITVPVANAGINNTLTCTNTSFILGSAPVAGNTYSWSPSAGLSVNNIAQPTATAPGNYTLTVTNTSNGCTATDAVSISQNIIPPTANAGADKILNCTNTSFVIGTTAIAGNTYIWSPSLGLSVNNIAQPTATAPGIYILTVTNTANGCTSTDAVTVSQNIIPPAANAGIDKTLTCANPSLSIGTAAVTGNTYAWSPAIGLSANNIAEPTANAPGIYTVTVTNTANGCTATDDVTITQNITSPVANAGTDKTLTCVSTSFVIGALAVTGNTYAWSPAAGLSANNIAQPIVTAPGIYTLTVTNTANGCTATDAVIISQDITPPVANAGIDKTLTCTVTSLVIGSANIVGNSYAWSPSAGLSASTIAQPNAIAPGTYTLIVTKSSNGCTATDAVIISENITPPVANAGADKTLTCTNTSLLIGTTAFAGNTYAWSPVAGLSDDLIAQPTTTTTGTFTVTVTNTINGCTATDGVTIDQNIVPPTANAGLDKILTCANPSLGIGTAAIAGNSYSWSPATGLSATNTAQPNTNAPNIYTVTVTNNLNGCTSTDDVTITQDITPPVSDAGIDKSLTCTNTSFVIGSAAIAGNTYAWTPATGLSVSNIAQPTATAPGTYTLTATNTTNGCKTNDAVIISKNITPPTANAGADKTLTCTDTSFLIGSAPIAGNTYAWSPAVGLSADNIAQPNTSTPDTYTLTVTNTVNGCIATDNITVVQNITPPVADAGINKTLTCSNPSLIIGTTAVAGNTYAWSPATGLSSVNIAQPSANKAGTYTLIVTNTTNGCTSTDVVDMSIDTVRPFADAGPNKTLTCATTSFIIGSPEIIGNTYSWSPVGGLDNPLIAQPVANTLNNYTVTVTKTTNGCKASDQVIILQNITTSAAVAGSDLTLTCTKQSFDIGTPAVAGNSYAWSPSTGLNDVNISQPTANKPGTYTLTVTNLANGCTSNDAVTIGIDTIPPVANAGLDKTLICTVHHLAIGTPAVTGHTYSWSPSSGLNFTTIAQPSANTTGIYTLTVTKTATGCKSSDSMEVLVDTIRPIADAGEDQTFGCPHASLTVGTPALSNMVYNWTNALGLSASNIAQPTTDTSGRFVLIVTSAVNLCKSDPDTIIISPKNCDCEFYIPTAFSPNNDGINDILAPFKNCDNFTDLSFTVFNRWGELVFKSKDINDGWNGFYKSESQQVDSYMWILEYFDVLNNTKKVEKGVVSLLK